MNRFLKSKRRWLVLLAVALLVGVVIWRVKHREPSHQGRSLSEWMADFKSSNRAVQEKAAEAIRQMGAESLPQLVKYLEPESSMVHSIRKWSYGLSTRQGGFIRSLLPPTNLELPAMQALMVLGPASSPAIPGLVKRANDQPLIVPMVLGSIGTNAIPELVKLLDSTNATVLENTIMGVELATGRFQLGWPTTTTASGPLPPELKERAVRRLEVLALDSNLRVSKAAAMALNGLAPATVPNQKTTQAEPSP